jgi:hypothetical protein
VRDLHVYQPVPPSAQDRTTLVNVNRVKMGRIRKTIKYSLSLGPIPVAQGLEGQGLEGILARLLAYSYAIPA